MDQQQNILNSQGSVNIWAIIATVVVTTIIAGGITYYWQNTIIEAEKQSLQQQINQLQNQVAVFEDADEDTMFITDEQAQEMMDIFDEGTKYYDKLLDQNDSNAIQKTVNWFKSQEKVEDAAAAPGTIWVKFKAGDKEFALFTHRE